ncbi:hypothetical protein SDC9_08989 [bioreactor metagenome]|uniref:Uncharacterized protein n=1 Tax=bioreactor metagenome TaxID=1076179 RepID=A0A644T8U9_9ZZZZ
MYKLIIGNIRVTVSDDSITREQAATAARQAISTAHQQGKFLSLIEINTDDAGIQVTTTEKTGCRAARKTLKQSMLDDMYATLKEKMYPTNLFTNKDVWYDGDTGQEWHGSEVDNVKDELMAKLEEWMKTV